MCIILGKYFKDFGWVGAKNRDRDYTPTLNFIESEKHGIGRMMMHDLVTGYKEGINSKGISILNTSLDTGDDESEVDNGQAKVSPDGAHIAEALLQSNVVNAMKVLIKRKLVGCTIVFDKENMYLMEASDQDNTRPYKYVVKKIPNTETVARTNHGIWLPWASFQRNSKNKQEVLHRISSEARLLQAQVVVETAREPEDLVNGMCKVFIDHPQLNIMRMSKEKGKFRTTSQQLCIPKERTLYCRPVSSHLKFDFWTLNKPEPNVWVEILSNRALWQDTRGDPPFGQMKLKDI